MQKQKQGTRANGVVPASRSFSSRPDAAGRGACGEVAGAAPVGTEEERRRRVEEHAIDGKPIPLMGPTLSLLLTL